MSQVKKLTYTEAEFCQAVGIGQTKAYELRKAGKIAYTPIGRKIYYTQKQVEDFLANQAVEVKARFRNAG